MKSLFLPLCLSAGLFAQSAASVFEKAPPAQDEALRKQATAFFQTHVDGKTRQAMAMVADEAQDTFFEMQKPKLLSFEIQQVKYAKDFKQASVLILAEREIAVPFGGVQNMKVPMESYWKEVGGQWRWFIPKSDCKETPFGCVPTTGNGADPEAAAKVKAQLEKLKAMNFEGEFGFDRNMLEMTSGDQVEIKFRNGLPGFVTLKYREPFSDPEVELVDAEQQVKPNSEATVTVRVKKGVKITKAREILVPLYVQPFSKHAGLRVMLRP